MLGRTEPAWWIAAYAPRTWGPPVERTWPLRSSYVASVEHQYDSDPTPAIDVLRTLDLGNSIAEFDEALESYFVETEIFRQLVAGSIDIVAGDKGTGKTALFRILHRRYALLAELDNVEVVPAFNITGNPIFQRINEGEVLSEGQYTTMWKAFVLSLAGNWVLQLYEDAFTDRMFELDELLTNTGLRSADDSPTTVFSSIINLFRRLMSPDSVEGTLAVTPEGLPVIGGRVEFGNADSPPETIYHEDALTLLNAVLEETGLELWLVLDRLDEAFAGLPEAEIPALRALLRTYLDLVPFEHVKLKLFVRRDLFVRIIEGGFVNLTHVNARKQEILWDEDSLSHLLMLRVRGNPDFLDAIGSAADDDNALFRAIFPEQVDQGSRRPTTWNWIMGRIRDANHVKPPRNLIDLIKKAQEAQIRREERERSDFTPDRPLIGAASMKSALSALSKQRVEDTLLAEAGAEAAVIDRFRNGKAEHNDETLQGILEVEGEELERQVQFLRAIGFLELTGTSHKVPMLYRDGLRITQGRAFSSDAPDDDE